MTVAKRSVFILIAVVCLLVGGLGIVMLASKKIDYAVQTAPGKPGDGPSSKEQTGQRVEKTVVLDWKWSW